MIYHVQFPGLGLDLTVNRVALSIGGFNIYWYGVIIAAGMLLAMLYAFRNAVDYGIDSDRLVDVVAIGTVMAIVCARIYYVAMAPFAYQSIWEMIDIRKGGIAIYGAVIGAFIFGGLAAKWRKVPLLPLFDLVSLGFLIGQGIGRWGNFVNQEAYGVPVTTPALQWFPLAVYIEREGGWFAATFFYESAWCFLICALILILERTRLFARPGRATLFYVFMYAAERTVVEGLRMDSLYLGSVRVSQALSALLLLAAALLLCLRLPRRRKWLLIPTLAAIPLFFLSPLAYALLLLAVCLVCYEMTPAGGEPPIRT